jgi:hypothetical protein
VASGAGISLDTLRALEGNRVATPSFVIVARLARELQVQLDAVADESLSPTD